MLVEPTDHFRRGAATALLALADWAAGDLDAAVSGYADAIDAFVTADHLPDVLGCSLALADIQIAQASSPTRRAPSSPGSAGRRSTPVFAGPRTCTPA